MTILVNPQDVIIQMPPGSAIYGRIFRPGPFTDFYVREETKVIKSFHNPVIVIRPGIFYMAYIALVVVMFQIGKHPDQIFETWFNYYATNEDGKKAFESLTTQENIAFHLYGNGGQKVKSIVINNNLKNFFEAAITGIEKIQPWLMSDFDKARAKLYLQFPTPSALWKKLGEAVQ